MGRNGGVRRAIPYGGHTGATFRGPRRRWWVTGTIVIAVVLGATVFALSRGFPASATTTSVDCSLDTPSGSVSTLADAIASASPGDTLLISGTCTETAVDHGDGLTEFTIDKNLTLQGEPGATLYPAGDAGHHLGRVIEVTGGAHVTLENLHITLANYGGGSLPDQSAETNAADGGGIFIAPGSEATVEDDSVIGNSADSGGTAESGYGGGIYNGGTVTIENSYVASNAADGSTPLHTGGVGLYNAAGATATISQTIIDDNGFTAHGAGIYNDGTMNLTASTVSNNGPGIDGGGIDNDGSGVMDIVNSTIEGNTAEGDWISESFGCGPPTVGYGGGIDNSGKLTLTMSTLADNKIGLGEENQGCIDDAGGYGGGIYNASSETLEGTILAGNTINIDPQNDEAGPNCEDVGSSTSDGYNIEDGTGDCSFLKASTDKTGTSADLSSPGYNGGPLVGQDGSAQTTLNTLVPQAGSPALDAVPISVCDTLLGSSPTDERGVPRPQGSACDTGAVEVVVKPVVTTVNLGTVAVGEQMDGDLENVQWPGSSVNACGTVSSCSYEYNQLLFEGSDQNLVFDSGQTLSQVLADDLGPSDRGTLTYNFVSGGGLNGSSGSLSQNSTIGDVDPTTRSAGDAGPRAFTDTACSGFCTPSPIGQQTTLDPLDTSSVFTALYDAGAIGSSGPNPVLRTFGFSSSCTSVSLTFGKITSEAGAFVTDYEGEATECQFVPTTLAVTTTSLPGGTVGTFYPSTTLGASGGTPGYTWALADGTKLPAGLSLSSVGVITGTPTGTPGTTTFAVVVTDASSPTPQSTTATLSITVADPVLGDFTGSGSADIALYRPASGTWYIDGEPAGTVYGTSSDTPVPGDYLGNGKTQIAVYRPGTGGGSSTWYIDEGTTSEVVSWGTRGDIPVPGDYLGNGKTQIAVYRPGTGGRDSVWYIQGEAPITFGTAGDVPVPGDYLGNGMTQLAVFRPSTGTWYIYGGPTVVYGGPGDIPVQGDYLGNGSDQIAVYRPGTNGGNSIWYIDQGTTSEVVPWGTSADVPVPADYLGNAKTQIAVYRPGTGGGNSVWYIDGIAGSTAYGTAGDVPVLERTAAG